MSCRCYAPGKAQAIPLGEAAGDAGRGLNTFLVGTHDKDVGPLLPFLAAKA